MNKRLAVSEQRLALDAILKKIAEGEDLSDIESVIFWVWDDGTKAAVELSAKAAAELATLRARLHAAEQDNKNLVVLLAWLSETISEGKAAALIGVDRLKLRTMRDDFIAALKAVQS